MIVEGRLSLFGVVVDFGVEGSLGGDGGFGLVLRVEEAVART